MKKLLISIAAALCLLSISAFAEGFASGYVTCSTLNVRSEPNTSSTVVTKLSMGEKVDLLYCNGYNWYCVKLSDGSTGFCSSDYISLQPVQSGTADSIIAMANSLLGRPYVYGASGPSAFDCSGFTSYVYKAHGISLPRSSAAQSGVGTTVSRDELLPGDLVFFATGRSGAVSHVGIYIGDGDIIHAASGQGRITINNLSQSYYSSRYKWAKRVF